jgi:6-pyruvoyltetrahydropterin/6-carboxytetrahydropterin synthase
MSLTVVAGTAKAASMIEITQEFTFDAAHRLDAGAPENRRIHGHSFYAEVTLRGEPDSATGMLREFGSIKEMLGAIAEELDHRMLNDIPDLGAPTLENITCWIFRRARSAIPEVVRVRVRRPSYGETCSYEE